MIHVVQGISRLSDDISPPSSRLRVVWTRDEKKHFDRTAKDCNNHGDKLLMRCGSSTCPDPRVVIHEDASNPGGMVLRCGCTDRHFTDV